MGLYLTFSYLAFSNDTNLGLGTTYYFEYTCRNVIMNATLRNIESKYTQQFNTYGRNLMSEI